MSSPTSHAASSRPIFNFAKCLKDEHKAMSSENIFESIIGNYPMLDAKKLRQVRNTFAASYAEEYQNPMDCANVLISHILDPEFYNHDLSVRKLYEMPQQLSAAKQFLDLVKSHPHKSLQYATSAVCGICAASADEIGREKYLRDQEHYLVMAASYGDDRDFYKPAVKDFADSLYKMGTKGTIYDAAAYYSSLVLKKYAPASYGQGVLCERDQTYSGHPTHAVDHFRCAADQGYPQAQYKLGAIEYRNGKTDAALDLYRRAIDGGLERANYDLGAHLFRAGDTTKGFLHVARAIGSKSHDVFEDAPVGAEVGFIARTKLLGGFRNNVNLESDANSSLSKDEILEVIRKLKSIPEGRDRIIKDSELVKKLVVASERATVFSAMELNEFYSELASTTGIDSEKDASCIFMRDEIRGRMARFGGVVSTPPRRLSAPSIVESRASSESFSSDSPDSFESPASVESPEFLRATPRASMIPIKFRPPKAPYAIANADEDAVVTSSLLASGSGIAATRL